MHLDWKKKYETCFNSSFFAEMAKLGWSLVPFTRNLIGLDIFKWLSVVVNFVVCYSNRKVVNVVKTFEHKQLPSLTDYAQQGKFIQVQFIPLFFLIHQQTYIPYMI